MRIEVEINGRSYEGEVEPRTLLSDFIRHQAGLTGTHVGCEHGVCGACTVQLDGEAVRSCLMLAVQANGRSLRTVEGLAGDGELHPLQRAFNEAHALQCGFCTSGFLMTLEAFLRENPEPSEEEIREALAGNLCRCTGYVGIVEAARKAARELRASAGSASRSTIRSSTEASSPAEWMACRPSPIPDRGDRSQGPHSDSD